ncbi:MAG: prepilin-type N-terminal cleavage/methylation domain-containing protein [Candidatus Aminicenantes bacterium]|nr:prepilin-type N-terminal cleavage/methylation domain-containing protein [Candidatus Aminicenantes bacterium]
MRQEGFTLIELLIVLVLFGAIIVMVATVSPAIALKSKLNRSVNELISDLNFAKQVASSENCYVSIIFGDNGTSYTIRKLTDITNFYIDSSEMEYETIWEKIKTARPLDGDPFFQKDEVTDFAFSSTGLVRLFDISNKEPARIDLVIFIKKKQSAGDIDFSKKIKIYPYGGVSVEE